MTARDEAVLTAAQLTTLRRLAAVVTPGGGGFPSSEEADPTGEVLDLALHHLARDLGDLGDLLDRGAEREPADFVDELVERSPEQFEVLRRLLVCRYLTSRPVWDMLGYTGRRPSPAAPGEADSFLADGILDAVIGRGPCYIPTPTGEGAQADRPEQP